MQMRMIIGLISMLWMSCASAGSAPGDEQVYHTQDDYLQGVFQGAIPHPGTIWPDSALRGQLKDILGRKPGLRFRYWGADGKTAWILDQIGKDRPITAGVVINQGKIEDIRVLVFRESRGWEVKYDFFTRQFSELWLDSRQELSGSIDNITGATLSVNAMKRMARAALLLHEYSNQNTQTLANAR